MTVYRTLQSRRRTGKRRVQAEKRGGRRKMQDQIQKILSVSFLRVLCNERVFARALV
jgi:hypothetical protein